MQTGTAEVAHLEEGRALREGSGVGIEHVELAPGHAFDRLLLAQARRLVRAHRLAVAIDRDTIGDPFHLVPAMRGEDDADALRPQRPDQAKEPLHLARGQG